MARSTQIQARKRAKYQDASFSSFSRGSTASAANDENDLTILAIAAATQSTTSAADNATAAAVVTPTHNDNGGGGGTSMMESPVLVPVLLDEETLARIFSYVASFHHNGQQQQHAIQVHPHHGSGAQFPGFTTTTAAFHYSTPGAFGRQSLLDQDMEEENTSNNGSSLFETVCTLALVCKKWRMVVGCMMNAQAPPLLLSPRDLFLLKTRALSLDLTDIGQDFVQDLRDKWNDQHYYAYGQYVDCLNVLFRSFGDAKSEVDFIHLVAGEYIQFLIVRIVEAMASNKAFSREEEPRPIRRWKEACAPPALIHLFWKAHMSSPQQYARDCNTLVDNLLFSENGSMDNILQHYNNNDAWGSGMMNGSDYESKKSVLFRFEHDVLEKQSQQVWMARFSKPNEMTKELLFGPWFHPRDVVAQLAASYQE